MAKSSSDSFIGSIVKFLIDLVVDVAKDLQKKYDKPVVAVKQTEDSLTTSTEHDFYGEDIDLINKFNG